MTTSKLSDFLQGGAFSATDRVVTVRASGAVADVLTTISQCSGTVTSIGASAKSGIIVSGSPVTTSGNITYSLGNITPTTVNTGVVSATSLNVTGDVLAATGRVTASAATIASLLTGATASFSGVVSANAGIKGTTAGFSGAITGSNLTGTNTGDQTITLTGDVSGSGTGSFATTINPATVTNAKLSNMNAFTVKSNITSSAAVPIDNSLSAIIDASVSGGVQGDILYRSGTVWTRLGVGTSGQVLTTNGASANPTWTSPGGSGTVTSVSAGVGLTATPNPITGAGSIQINSNQIIRGPVAYVNGNGSTPTAGAFAEITIPYAGTITNWALAADVSGQAQFEIKRSGTSIVGSGNLPTLNGNIKITQAVSGWTSTAITAGDVIAYSLVSATTIGRCGLTLTVNAT